MKRAALAAAVLLAVACADKGGRMEYAAWSPAGGGYSLEVPAAWELRDESDEAPPGLVLLKADRTTSQGRQALSEPASLIRVSYYEKGNAYYDSPEALAGSAAPGSKVERSRVAGLPAIVFRSRFQEPFPPGSAKAKPVKTVSQYVVVSGSGGFWSFQLTAPESRYGSVNRVFRRLVESFRIE